MKIKYIDSLASRDHFYDELSKSNQFIEIKYDQDLKRNFIDASMSHVLIWIDLSTLDDDTKSKALAEIKSPEFGTILSNISLFVVVSTTPGPSPKPKPDPSAIPFEEIIDFRNAPYPNIDLTKIVNMYNIPWQAIYSEYFWTSISSLGSIALFGNKTYRLNEEDVVLFILGSRYFGKVRYVFKFGEAESMLLQNTFKTITLLLHGLDNPEKLPIIKAKDLIKNYNIASVFDLDKMCSYLSDDQGNLKLETQKMLKLAENISVPLKTLNFDYWLKAIIGRMAIERHKNDYVAKYSVEDYTAAYHLFSGLEHSTDFVFVTLFELANRVDFDQTFAKAQEFMK